MTENKRYIILDSPNTMPFICDRIDNDKTIAEVHMDNVNQLCDLLNELSDENEQLKDELFDVTTSLIYETSSNINEDIEKARKEIYGDSE